MEIPEFRVIIAGGRDFTDYNLLRSTMDVLLRNKLRKEKIVVICGMAKGADMLGARYAKERGYHVRYFPAEWDKLGKRAGIIRNEEMAQNADALVAFWDGSSHGTKNMIETAERYNLAVRVKRYSNKKKSSSALGATSFFAAYKTS